MVGVFVTVAVFVTEGTAAAATETSSVILGREFPAASGPACVQVTSCKTAPQVHPVPVAETKVKPAGNVSVAVIGPTSALAEASLLTLSV